jgi:hypothetical protein
LLSESYYNSIMTDSLELLKEIIGLLSQERSSLSEVLLKTKVLLHDIGKKELIAWINMELNGYPQDAELPDYRIIPWQVRANSMNIAYIANDHAVPIQHLKEKQRRKLEIAEMREALAVLQELAASQGPLRRSLPVEASGILSEGLASGYVIQEAWCQASPHSISNILAQIRSRLLDFLLELRGTIGVATSPEELRTRAEEANVTPMFQHAIFGPNTTFVIGDANKLHLHNQVTEGDFDALSRTLHACGVSADDMASLHSAIDEDRKTEGKASWTGKTGQWLTKLLHKAGKGVAGVSVDVIASTITKALTSFIGS